MKENVLPPRHNYERDLKQKQKSQLEYNTTFRGNKTQIHPALYETCLAIKDSLTFIIKDVESLPF